MPSILITTSRRTSNRVRTFARDLSTVLPDSYRFNRGGMSLNELISKITQDNANAALVISTYRGNPSNIQFLQRDGIVHYELHLESAVLRREVANDVRNRIDKITMVVTLLNSSELLKKFAQYLSSLLSVPIATFSSVNDVTIGTSNQAFILLQESGRKIHWSWHLATNHVELGPRIRITRLRSKSND